MHDLEEYIAIATGSHKQHINSHSYEFQCKIITYCMGYHHNQDINLPSIKSEYKLEAWMGGFMMELKLEMVQNVECLSSQ